MLNVRLERGNHHLGMLAGALCYVFCCMVGFCMARMRCKCNTLLLKDEIVIIDDDIICKKNDVDVILKFEYKPAFLVLFYCCNYFS